MNIKLINAIEQVEIAHFRTVDDTGAHPCAMMVLNNFRTQAGLPYLSKDDLPAWNDTLHGYYMPPSSRLLCAPAVLAKGGRV